jgi:hypothetical protein
VGSVDDVAGGHRSAECYQAWLVVSLCLVLEILGWRSTRARVAYPAYAVLFSFILYLSCYI